MTESAVVLDALYAAALIYAGPASYFDIASTVACMKTGHAYEANPFMAWLQAKFPSSWAWVKAALMLATAGAVAFGIPALGRFVGAVPQSLFLAVVVIVSLIVIEAVAIIKNYQIAAE